MYAQSGTNNYNPYGQQQSGQQAYGQPPMAQAIPVSQSYGYQQNQEYKPNEQQNANIDPYFASGAAGEAILVSLGDVENRMGFIRKVYTILTIQLAVTVAFIAFFTFFEPAQIFIQENPGVFYGALVVAFVMVIVLSCFVTLARKFPINLIFLSIFTIAESVFIGFFAAQFAIQDILFAMGTVMIVTVALTFYACQTKYDFTGWGPYLFVALIVVFVFMIILIFIQESRTVRIVFAIIVVLLFSMYLVYDTQLVVGGQHKKFQFSVDDYVFAALNLYLDIITIFMYLLLLFGGGSNN